MTLDNSIYAAIIGVVGGLFSGLGIWLLDFIRERRYFRRDEAKIVRYLKSKLQTTRLTDRSTNVIAAVVNLTPIRVFEICSNSNRILVDFLEKEIWTVSNA